MITQWIEACEVQRVSLDGGLVLNLEDHNELVITRPLRLSIPALEAHPAEDLIVDPDDVPALPTAAGQFLGAQPAEGTRPNPVPWPGAGPGGSG